MGCFRFKSATDNIGTFDGGNPDIRYLIDQKSGRTLGRFFPDMKEGHLNPGATVETLAHEFLHAAQNRRSAKAQHGSDCSGMRSRTSGRT